MQGRLPAAHEAEALKVNDQRKKSAKAKQKASLTTATAKPRPVAGSREPTGSRSTKTATFRQQWTRTAAGLSEEEQRKTVLQAIEAFKQLPSGSQYAQHRLKVLHQALTLLHKDRERGEVAIS
ncbi:hypothetical protein N2152v2_010313 [Parachlorella kessleri]